MTIEEAVENALSSNDPQKVVESIPYMNFLGIQIQQDQHGPVCMLPGAEHIIGNPVLPAIHGGVLGALLESTAVMHVIWVQQKPAIPKIVNLTVEYHRSARVVETFAQARITKQGRRISNVFVEAWQADRGKPVATAHCHFLTASGD